MTPPHFRAADTLDPVGTMDSLQDSSAHGHSRLPAVEETEKTVISSNTPIPGLLLPTGLRPHELGQVLVGQKLGDYWLEEFVGGGGMGAVFRARDTKLNRNVAVKVLSTAEAGNTELVHRFQVEAQSAARLDHPHIARVHSVGEDQGVPFIVFEYIDGANLRDTVRSAGPLPLSQALDYTLQITDALAHAWQRDVVHRDIKPSNILITLDGQAKLVDMGLARLDHMDQTNHELTASGMTIGTFDYIAPEQARNPKDADTRSDIYSLGCTLFFLLTGHPPFSGGTALQKLLQHQGVNPPSLQHFREDISPAVVEVVEIMLSKRPEDRFQNPPELLVALIQIAEELGIRHAPVMVPTSWPGGMPRNKPWRRHLPWAVPLALLLGTVVGIELLLSPGNQPTGWQRPPENGLSPLDDGTPEFPIQSPVTSSPPTSGPPGTESPPTGPPPGMPAKTIQGPLPPDTVPVEPTHPSSFSPGPPQSVAPPLTPAEGAPPASGS